MELKKTQESILHLHISTDSRNSSIIRVYFAFPLNWQKLHTEVCGSVGRLLFKHRDSWLESRVLMFNNW